MDTPAFGVGDHVQVEWPDGHLDGRHGQIAAVAHGMWRVRVDATEGLFRTDELRLAPGAGTWTCPSCPPARERIGTWQESSRG